MQLPDEAPKLPKLPFLIGDGLLLATAFVIVQRSEAPLAAAPLAAIVACVAVGAVLAVIPFLIDYARRQEAALTERQNSLEALARTTAAAAEQISIAASGLHTIAEIAHKNLKATEQLPHKLQEKINEFNQMHDEAIVEENEALTQEVNSLRASETEKLETASDHIHRTAAEFGKLEASIQRHLATLNEALVRLPVLAEQAGRQAGEAVASASDDAVARLLAEIDARLAAATGVFSAHTAESGPAATATKARTPTPVATAAAAEVPTPPPIPVAVADDTPSAPGVAANPPAATTAKAATPRKRTRKDPPTQPGLQEADEPAATYDEDRASSDQIETTDAPEGIERSLSADGLTRLIVTAYIGIGNRLYVRGDGPGLSRDKGAPLQFVSIGKWRWETADAAAPIALRIYKNDQTECAVLGAVTLDPGQQVEVTATF